MTVSIAKNPRVVYRDLGPDEGGVLLHLQTGAYHGVNTTGALIWRLLDEPRTTSEVASEIRRSVSGVPDDLEAALGAFLDDLRARDLVVPAEETP